MIDWSESAQRTYEYYIVDPGTWMDSTRLEKVRSSSITRDSSVATLGSASFSIDEDIGECYVRTYMVSTQNGVEERTPLGTHLLQTFPTKYNGLQREIQVDAYTPLIELKENLPPVGYYIPKGSNIMSKAYEIVRENVRAPVIMPRAGKTLPYDFVSNVDDTWLTFVTDLISLADYEFDLDEMGRILFAPLQEVDALKPVWIYTDDNSSILYPDVSINNDLFNVPNVIEVIHSTDTGVFYAKVSNNDSGSPVSIFKRGRTITVRETNPTISGEVTNAAVYEYAKTRLKALSSLTHTVSYSHGYCPVRLRDGVRLNYTRSGINAVNAKVTQQTIDCTPECKVTETAVFSSKLWEG